MATKELNPWHFTIIFDEQKAQRNGYGMDVLYDYVDKTASSYHMERFSEDTWQPMDGVDDEVPALCGTLLELSKAKWVMQNIQSLAFYEGDGGPKPKSWHFTIVFDEQKAKENGYDMKTLYDYVDKTASSYHMERFSEDTWQPMDGVDEVLAQCGALLELSKEKWVMQNIKSLTFYEGDDDPNDFLAIIHKRNPERICD